MENLNENVRRRNEMTPEAVKEVLQSIVEAIKLPENEAKISAAKEVAGGDMMVVMKNVFPIVIEIQKEVVGEFGFTKDEQGLKEFLTRVKECCKRGSGLEKEILELMKRIRENYLPGFQEKIKNNDILSLLGGYDDEEKKKKDEELERKMNIIVRKLLEDGEVMLTVDRNS